MSATETVADIADLKARVKQLEGDNTDTKRRISGLEKVIWGWGGALGIIGLVVGRLTSG